MDAVVTLMLVLCACVGFSSACSCMQWNGPERYCNYDVIVRGTAVAEYKEREEPLDHSDPFAEFDPYADWVYTIDVEEAIKVPGNMTKAKTLQLRTSTQESLCGTRFGLDVSGIFFAYLNYDGELETGICDPNAPWDSMNEWDQGLITDHIVEFCANKDKGVAPPEP